MLVSFPLLVKQTCARPGCVVMGKGKYTHTNCTYALAHTCQDCLRCQSVPLVVPLNHDLNKPLK